MSAGLQDVEPPRQAGLLPGTRMVLGIQYLLGAAYLLGAVGVLLSAAVRTGNYEALLNPGLEHFGDPKDSIPPVGPRSVWNPSAWIFELARAVSIFIGPLAAIAALVGMVYLPGTKVRSHPRTFTWLAAGTAACVALFVLSLTPYGMQLQHWLLD